MWRSAVTYTILKATKGYGSSWIFELHLTCANAHWGVQYPAFSLVSRTIRLVGWLRMAQPSACLSVVLAVVFSGPRRAAPVFLRLLQQADLLLEELVLKVKTLKL